MSASPKVLKPDDILKSVPSLIWERMLCTRADRLLDPITNKLFSNVVELRPPKRTKLYEHQVPCHVF